MSSSIALVIQKIISMLQANSSVTQFVTAGNIHAAHISTIQDYSLPAVSIHVFAGPGRETAGPFFDRIAFQIDVWMRSIGANPNTWDDVMNLHESITAALHRCGGWDESLGIRILEITNTSNGPQMEENGNGIMHYPSVWFVRATQ